MRLQERVEFIEQSLRHVVERLDSDSRRPDLSISQVLNDEDRSIGIRMEVCHPIARDQIAWCLLLAAFKAYESGKAYSVTALGSFAHAPPTTALRWIENLIDAGLLLRQKNPLDARSANLELSATGFEMMRGYGAKVIARK